jgi:hypothetical protein
MASEKAEIPPHPPASSSHSSLHDDQSKEVFAEESTPSGPPTAQAGDVETNSAPTISEPTKPGKSDVNHMGEFYPTFNIHSHCM